MTIIKKSCDHAHFVICCIDCVFHVFHLGEKYGKLLEFVKHIESSKGHELYPKAKELLEEIGELP